MDMFEKIDYSFESRCCGAKFMDQDWELDCPNQDGAALIFKNYKKIRRDFLGGSYIIIFLREYTTRNP